MPCIGTLNRFESPSTALGAASPPLGEKDGMRGSDSWKRSYCFELSSAMRAKFARPPLINRFKSQENCLLARRTHGGNSQPRARQFRDGLEISARPGRKFFPVPDVMGRLPPAGKLGIDRLALAQQFDVVRHVVVATCPNAVADTSLDDLQRVQ